jgi:hypothetical protein
MRKYLWIGVPPSEWPIVPEHRAVATLHLQSTGSRGELQYLRWLGKQKLRTFRADDAEFPLGNGERIMWATSREHEPLIAWRDHLAQGCAARSRDINACLETVLDWWDTEGEDVAQRIASAPGLEELHIGLIQRVDLIDQVVWRIWRLSASPHSRPDGTLWAKLPTLADSLEALGGSLWRTRLALAVDRLDHAEVDAIDRDLASAVLNPRKGAAFSPVTFVKDWMGISEFSAPVLLDSLVATVATNRPSGLWQALSALSLIVGTRFQWIERRHLALIANGLAALAPKLDYASRSTGSGIEDEEVPLLRFMCARLASALHNSQREESFQAIARTWLDAASTDPLPEMRLKRFILM